VPSVRRGTCENRKAAGRDEIRRRHFLDATQSMAEVVRHRIRDKRQAQGLTQAEVARRMTIAGAPLSGDMVSKIETGVRSVTVEELAAFAAVLGVPLVKLMSPLDGERHMRVTSGYAIESSEVGNWVVWGFPWTTTARNAQEFMRLFLEICYWTQAVKEQAVKEGSSRQRLVETVERAHAAWHSRGRRSLPEMPS
jgi:transcriptional regulator with XRE-family HTH domain